MNNPVHENSELLRQGPINTPPAPTTHPLQLPASASASPSLSFSFPESPSARLASLQATYRTELQSLAPRVHRLAIILGYDGAHSLPGAALALPKSSLSDGLKALSAARVVEDTAHTTALQLGSLYVLCHPCTTPDANGPVLSTSSVDDAVLYLLRVGMQQVPAIASTSQRTPGCFRMVISMFTRMLGFLWRLVTRDRTVDVETQCAIAKVQLLVQWIRQVRGYITAEDVTGADATARLLQRVQLMGPSANAARVDIEALGNSDAIV